ncbi:MAG: FAD-dependent 5-carboxymethylaminomethyl-2-thiouridine(34) oxidoreductase MnmC [Rhodoferax sp.]|nr:FAD-dependent 5-carboxymethylaminomethyl-2-thiouridine(34) oxidoreductase MnmC [Rhodoferax sp.]
MGALPPSSGILAGCDLASTWRDQSDWTVLDTGFGDGQSFLHIWHTWLRDPHRARRLHYVGLTGKAQRADAMLRSMAGNSALASHRVDLQRQWFGFMPGFHRLTFCNGELLLTLCVGELMNMLRELQCVANFVLLGDRGHEPPESPWDTWSVKALARVCKPGTCALLAHGMEPLLPQLAGVGFVTDPTPHAPAIALRFEPVWTQRITRDPWRRLSSSASTCAVVGAGLAGAAAALAMARRGWLVTVVDQAAHPAAGASGLPVGLLVPHATRDDNTRSRLARSGVRQTLDLCAALLQEGEDWSCCGVLELGQDPTQKLATHWPEEGLDWSARHVWPQPEPAWARGARSKHPVWHPKAAWVKPARLVQAQLESSAARFIGARRVSAITRGSSGWELRDPAGEVITQAACVIMANAGDALRLLGAAQAGVEPDKLAPDPLQIIAGQLSWAPHQFGDASAFPPHPVNGAGSLLPWIPMADGPTWFAGASFELQVGLASPVDAANQENLARLSQLLPTVANYIGSLAPQQPLHHWRANRCSSADRLPLAGPAQTGPQPTLWLNAAFGSRGLTYSVLCAELIAAQINAEPLPLPASLVRLLRPNRPSVLGKVRA